MAGPVVLAALAAQDWGAALDAPQRQALRAPGRAQSAGAARHGRRRGRGRQPAVAAPAGRRHLLLSGREREVLERIAAGDSNKLIARALDISPHTVKRHVANILDKLALDSRGQAAAWLRANP